MDITPETEFDNPEAERILRLQTLSAIEADQILRLQCLAAVEPSIIQKDRLKRAQEILDFVTNAKPETTDEEQPRNPNLRGPSD